MQIEAFGATHKGNIRSHNEDNVYVEGSFRNYLESDNIAIEGKDGTHSHTYAVFDGLGGEQFGEQASYIAALGLKKFEEQGHLADTETYVSVADKAICSEADRHGVRTIGTTYVMLNIEGDRAYISNIGDSRAYLLRGGALKQVSRDHSVVQSMIDNGFMDESERFTSEHTGELTQYLGMTAEDDIEPSPEKVALTVMPGDIFLLCSDGLTGELTDKEIESIMLENSYREARHIVSILIKKVLEGAANDNVSAVVCKIK